MPSNPSTGVDMIRMFTMWIASFAILSSYSLDAQAQSANGSKALGIEIGSKAVKPVVATLINGKVELTADKKNERGTSIVAGVVDGKLNDASIAATVDKVVEVYNLLKGDIPDDAVHIVISSGVVSQVKSIEDLKLELKAKLPKVTSVTSITYDLEVRYTLLAIAREQDKLGVPVDLTKMMVFDIGSGNTKFGYLAPGKETWLCPPDSNSGEGKYGTAALESKLAKDPKVLAAGGQKLAVMDTIAADYTKSTIQPEMKKLLEQIKCNGKKIYLTGGASYAVATLQHPDLSNERTFPISLSDAENVLKNVEPKLTQPLTKPQEANLARVQKVFSPEQQLVAAHLLKVSLETLMEVTGEKEFHFVSNSQTFWIEELMREKLNFTLKPPVAAPAVVPVPVADSETDALKSQIRKLQADLKAVVDAEKRPQPSSGSNSEAIEQLRKSIDKVAANTKAIADNLPKNLATSQDIQDLKRAILENNGKPNAPATRGPDAAAPASNLRKYNEALASKNYYTGVEFLQKSDFQSANVHLSAAIEDYDREPGSWYGLALVQLAMGDRVKARYSVLQLLNLRERGNDTTYGNTYIKVQGPQRIAVEDYILEVQREELLAGRKIAVK